jgi:hypothetical protein
MWSRSISTTCAVLISVALVAKMTPGECQQPAVTAASPGSDLTTERLERNFRYWTLFKKLRKLETAKAGSGVTALEKRAGLDASSARSFAIYAEQAVNDLATWTGEQRAQYCVALSNTKPVRILKQRENLEKVEREFRVRLDSKVARLPEVLDVTSIEKLDLWLAHVHDVHAHDSPIHGRVNFRVIHTSTTQSPGLRTEQLRLTNAWNAHCTNTP